MGKQRKNKQKNLYHKSHQNEKAQYKLRTKRMYKFSSQKLIMQPLNLPNKKVKKKCSHCNSWSIWLRILLPLQDCRRKICLQTNKKESMVAIRNAPVMSVKNNYNDL